jgi:VanZ family protein
MHKSSAWPLALAYAALIAYASLYPFSDWRDQGIAPWSFLTAHLPRYWTAFDVTANALGYAPLGFLLALSCLGSASPTLRRRPVVAAALGGGLLSLVMEMLQSYLPVRVASNVDLALNFAGAWGGAVVAWLLAWLGTLERWSRVRDRWLVAESRGAVVLLALWPPALLFPAALPFGLGQVLERLEEALADMLQNTPFLEWLPMREVELQPLVPGAEMFCVMLGALIPCLLGFSVLRAVRQRVVFAFACIAAGVGTTALSAALSYGPAHAWAWLNPPVVAGITAAGVMATFMLLLPRRACAAVLVLALALHLSVLNQAPTGAYFAVTLQTWEQGRFIRFHGLAQWLGWLWPYVALVYVLIRVSRREPRTSASGEWGSVLESGHE